VGFCRGLGEGKIFPAAIATTAPRPWIIKSRLHSVYASPAGSQSILKGDTAYENHPTGPRSSRPDRTPPSTAGSERAVCLPT